MTVREARPKLQIVLGVLLALDIAAIVVLLTPLAGRRVDREREFKQVHEALQEEIHKAAPLRNVEQKLATAQQQEDTFYKDRLPARDSMIPAELGKVADANGVRFSAIRYSADQEPQEGLRRIQVDGRLTGDYAKIVKVINALERDKLFFIIDSVSLGEQQGGNVSLDLKLETYLKDNS